MPFVGRGLRVRDGGELGAGDFESESVIRLRAGFVAYRQEGDVKILTLEESIQRPVPEIIGSGVEKRTRLGIGFL